jgi:SAM-dependent methyltransferase
VSELSRQYCKLCDLRDFDDPQLRAKLREIVAPGYTSHEELRRKFWEYAMLALYLEEVGAINEDAEALAVAAGHEEPLYWMANRIRRMVASDIYGEGDFSDREAAGTMLTEPASFAPYPYREDHLEVRTMNALALNAADDSFDIVFSLSSIEHFGSPTDIATSAREMARVLRPGGHLVLATECFVGSSPLDVPAVQFAIRLATLGRRCGTATLRERITDVFMPKEIRRDIVKPSGLECVQPLDETISPETYDNLIKWVGHADLCPRTGDPYPHILLKGHGAPWTSAFLALRKPGGRHRPAARPPPVRRDGP